MTEIVDDPTIDERKKNRAREAVRRAINNGTLVRPSKCERCGSSGKTKDGRSYVHAHHHKGYDRQLDVMWVCTKCHCTFDLRASGERNGRAKLTKKQVEYIRKNYKLSRNHLNNERSASYFMKKFSVGQTAILDIVNYRKWA